MKKTHVYLASPYSHKDPAVMEWRYRQAVRAAAALMGPQHVVFSPIAHSHEIGKATRTETGHEFWLQQDLPWLDRADELWVLCLDGWAMSRGVAEEMAYARKFDKAIRHVRPADLGMEEAFPVAFEDTQTFGELPLGEQLKKNAEDEAAAAQAWRESVMARDAARCPDSAADFDKKNERTEEARRLREWLFNFDPAQPGADKTVVALISSGGTGGSKPSNPKDIIGVRKAPLSCVPMNVVAEVGVGMLEGASKYGRHNYRAVGVRSSVYFDATMRHLIAFWEGEDLDPDSGAHHLAKALTSLVVWRDAQMQGMCEDDRPPRSVPFYNGLNAHAGRVIDRNADKNPHHYTIKDAA